MSDLTVGVQGLSEPFHKKQFRVCRDNKLFSGKLSIFNLDFLQIYANKPAPTQASLSHQWGGFLPQYPG
jgi:hypothetical protein